MLKNLASKINSSTSTVSRRVMIAGGTVAGLIVAGTVTALFIAKPEIAEVVEAVVVD